MISSIIQRKQSTFLFTQHWKSALSTKTNYFIIVTSVMFAIEVFCDTVFINILSAVLLMYIFHVDNGEFKAL